jgi:hypothetical protein
MRGAGFVAGSVLCACGIASLLGTAHAIPILQYVPATHVWTFHPTTEQIAMDWFFRAAVALASGAVAFVAARAIAFRSERAAGASAARFMLGLGFALVLWAALYASLAVVWTPRGPHAESAQRR